MRDIKTEISAVKSELKSDFDNKINQFMAELRDRDNQRHAEILTMQTRIDENVRGLRSEILTTNRWVMGLVVTAGLAFLGIAISLSIGMFNVVDIIRTLVVK